MIKVADIETIAVRTAVRDAYPGATEISKAQLDQVMASLRGHKEELDSAHGMPVLLAGAPAFA